jgi:AraC-like DNA-binding protein
MSRLVFNDPPFAPAWIALPPFTLSDCIVAVVGRNTQGFSLSDQDRLNYYPIHPYFTINVIFNGHFELCPAHVEQDGPRWRNGELSIGGPQTVPRSVLDSEDCHGIVILVYPDAWQRLSGMDAQEWTDRHVDARKVLSRSLLDAIQSMFDAFTDQQKLDHFLLRFTPLWQRCRGQIPVFGRQRSDTIRPWMQAIMLRAAQMHFGQSMRQVERRIKSWTGTSLRSLNKRARAEQALFLAWKIWMTSKEIDWATFAVLNGFSDQSHFIREIRDMTGFSPQEFRDGIIQSESFWIYRAWAQLLGVDAPKDD